MKKNSIHKCPGYASLFFDVLKVVDDLGGSASNQEIGDNLSPEDIADGFVDYVLWSTFRPESLGIDGELNMNSIDSGMLMTKEPTTAEKELDDCYCEAFGHQPPEDDILPLMTEVG